MKMDPLIQRAIAESPLPVTFEARKRHTLVRVGGRVVSKLPKGHFAGAGRDAMNVRAAIRRAAHTQPETVQ